MLFSILFNTIMSYCLFDLLFVQVPGVGEHNAIVPGKKTKVQDEFKDFPAPPKSLNSSCTSSTGAAEYHALVFLKANIKRRKAENECNAIFAPPQKEPARASRVFCGEAGAPPGEVGKNVCLDSDCVCVCVCVCV
jgi:hypothetical protein